MKPSVGRIVHYYEKSQGPFAAVVTAVTDPYVETVHLYVFPRVCEPGDLPTAEVRANVPNHGPTRWEWPPRE